MKKDIEKSVQKVLINNKDFGYLNLKNNFNNFHDNAEYNKKELEVYIQYFDDIKSILEENNRNNTNKFYDFLYYYLDNIDSNKNFDFNDLIDYYYDNDNKEIIKEKVLKIEKGKSLIFIKNICENVFINDEFNEYLKEHKGINLIQFVIKKIDYIQTYSSYEDMKDKSYLAKFNFLIREVILYNDEFVKFIEPEYTNYAGNNIIMVSKDISYAYYIKHIFKDSENVLFNKLFRDVNNEGNNFLMLTNNIYDNLVLYFSDINHQNNDGKNIFMINAEKALKHTYRRNLISILDKFEENEIDFTQIDFEGNTLLMIAAKKYLNHFMAHLLERNEDLNLNQKNIDGYSVFDILYSTSNEIILKKIFISSHSKIVNIDFEKNKHIIKNIAIKYDNIGKFLYNNYYDVIFDKVSVYDLKDMFKYKNYTLIYSIIQYKEVDLLEEDNKGNTIFNYICLKSYERTVEPLLFFINNCDNKDFGIDIPNKDGNSPIINIMNNMQGEKFLAINQFVVKYRKSIDFKRINNKNENALLFLLKNNCLNQCFSGNGILIDLLLSYLDENDINLRNYDGDTVFYLLSKNTYSNSLEILIKLLDKYPNIEINNKKIDDINNKEIIKSPLLNIFDNLYYLIDFKPNNSYSVSLNKIEINIKIINMLIDKIEDKNSNEFNIFYEEVSGKIENINSILLTLIYSFKRIKNKDTINYVNDIFDKLFMKLDNRLNNYIIEHDNFIDNNNSYMNKRYFNDINIEKPTILYLSIESGNIYLIDKILKIYEENKDYLNIKKDIILSIRNYYTKNAYVRINSNVLLLSITSKYFDLFNKIVKYYDFDELDKNIQEYNKNSKRWAGCLSRYYELKLSHPDNNNNFNDEVFKVYSQKYSQKIINKFENLDLPDSIVELLSEYIIQNPFNI